MALNYRSENSLISLKVDSQIKGAGENKQNKQNKHTNPLMVTDWIRGKKLNGVIIQYVK